MAAGVAAGQSESSPSSQIPQLPVWQRLLSVPKARLWQLNDVLGEIPVDRVRRALFAYPFARLHLAPQLDRIAREELRDAFCINRVTIAVLDGDEADFGCQLCGSRNLWGGDNRHGKLFVYGCRLCYECNKCHCLEKDRQGCEPSSSSGRN